MVRSKTIIAIPPGATIREQLEDRDMTQKEFANRMGLSEKHVSRLINGEVQLTMEVALGLEMVLGIPAKFWMNLEAIYREKIVRANEENEMDADMEIVKQFPYKQMADWGWIPHTKNAKEKVYNLRSFFEVAKLSLLGKLQTPGIVYRKVSSSQKSDYALAAWAQKAKIDARGIKTEAINIQKLQDYIPEIRKMTEEDPKVFCPRLVYLLATCGIALVFLPHIGGSFLHGASFYDGGKIVVGLTVRGKDADKFWFSLFHELGHIILGHLANSALTPEDQESEANVYARDILIPMDQYMRFVAQRNFSKASIIDFAHECNISPGIVVGRLQKENRIQYSFCNDLKQKYIIS